jgi:hypothetical protein
MYSGGTQPNEPQPFKPPNETVSVCCACRLPVSAIASALICLMDARRLGNRGGGRRSKGPRKFIGVRAPIALAEQMERAADEAGLCVSDYVASCMARVHNYDLSAPAPMAEPAPEVQQELPISA